MNAMTYYTHYDDYRPRPPITGHLLTYRLFADFLMAMSRLLKIMNSHLVLTVTHYSSKACFGKKLMVRTSLGEKFNGRPGLDPFPGGRY